MPVTPRGKTKAFVVFWFYAGLTVEPLLVLPDRRRAVLPDTHAAAMAQEPSSSAAL